MCQFLKISKDPHSPLWKFKYSFTHFFKFSGRTEPPTPPGNYNSLCGGGGMDIFWTCTIPTEQDFALLCENI